MNTSRLLSRYRPVALLAMLLVALPLWAAVPLPDTGSWEIAGTAEVLEDPSGDLTLDDVRQSGEWQPRPDTAFNKGYSHSAWWIRWSLTNNSDVERDRIVSVDYPLLQHLQLHIGSDNGADWRRVAMGAGLPFSARPYENRRFAVPISWAPGETHHFYLRVRTDTALQVPLTLWTKPAFQATGTFVTTVDGIYLGALVAIGLYNLLLFVAVRDRNYLLYVGVVFSIVMLVATLNGYTFRYFWPGQPDWNLQSIIVFFGLSLFFATLFSSSFLEVRRHSRWLNAVLLVEAALGMLIALFSTVLSYYATIVVAIPLAVFATVYGLIVAIYVWIRGQRTARYYILAWSFLLLGLMILALSKGGVLPSNGFTDSAVQVGSFMEVLLLSFALAQRINMERHLRFEAQKLMLDESERHNRELEERVSERTAELELANQRLNELSITDGLTGLKNRRYLDEALPREIARAERNTKPVSVVMIDIDQFKSLNDTFGHKAGDACLETLGRILASHVRTPDIAVRYGGEEFSLVFTDADLEGALRVVERLRVHVAQTSVPYGDVQLSFTISAGVATRSPGDAMGADSLIQQADQGLYRAKTEGRNRVCTYDPEQVIRSEMTARG